MNIPIRLPIRIADESDRRRCRGLPVAQDKTDWNGDIAELIKLLSLAKNHNNARRNNKESAVWSQPN